MWANNTPPLRGKKGKERMCLCVIKRRTTIAAEEQLQAQPNRQERIQTSLLLNLYCSTESVDHFNKLFIVK